MRDEQPGSVRVAAVQAGGVTPAVTVGPPVEQRRVPAFTASERLRLTAFYGVIVLLHLLGWGLFLHASAQHPAMVGLGLAAYLFGLRHAFDADHIAAVDDTVRYLLQKGESPLGVGFFFSLGHSSVVFGLCVGIGLSAVTVTRELPVLQGLGGIIGAGVSGVFLWVIGVLNLLVLLDILKIWRRARGAPHGHQHLDEVLRQRGLLNRLFAGRLRRGIHHSWQMYPLGLLFGLGFDTASEVGLLTMTAGAAVGDLPLSALLSLPILFTAGMTVMDTTDGVLMTKAYDWALLNPLRRIYYNITTTGLSVAVALLVGSVELLQAFGNALHLRGGAFDVVEALDLDTLGYVMVGLLLLAWGVSLLLWRFRGAADDAGSAAHRHTHEHDDGVTHTHPHLH